MQAALQRWLTPPVLHPDRGARRAHRGRRADGRLGRRRHRARSRRPTRASPRRRSRPGPARERRRSPPVGELTFPQVEHATLSNGIPVMLARRTAIPKVSLALTLRRRRCGRRRRARRHPVADDGAARGRHHDAQRRARSRSTQERLGADDRDRHVDRPQHACR